METIKVNMSPNPLDVQTIHASQNDGEARQWEFELHNNGELIDTSDVTEQLVFKAYKGGTEQLLPENGSTPTTSPFLGDIKYPQGLLTDQEFTYRQSPTEEDGLAFVKNIKGNTVKFNQQVDISVVPSSSVINGITYDKQTSEIKATGTASANSTLFISGSNYNIYNFINGHAYYLKGCPSGGSSSTYYMSWSLSGSDYGSGRIARATSDITGYIYARIISGVTVNNLSFKPQLFDLTSMGIDDLTTPTQVEEWLSTHIGLLPYYAYNQGSLLSFNGNGIKTVGKNFVNVDLELLKVRNSSGTWNGNEYTHQGVTFKVNLTSEGYIDSVVANGTATANANLNLMRLLRPSTFFNKPITMSGCPSGGSSTTYRMTLQMQTSPYTVVGHDYGNGLNTTIPDNDEDYQAIIRVISGYTCNNVVFRPMITFQGENQTYEPYTSSTLSLPVSTYFPNGMNGFDGYYDVLTENKAVKGIDALDLGIKNYSIGNRNTDNTGYTFWFQDRTMFQSAVPIRCAKFTQNNNVLNWESLKVNECLTSSSGYFVLCADYNDVASLKNALQGVYLYYPLVTPTETSFTTASLVTENAEIPLSNNDGVLVGKCTEELSAEPGFHDAKIKLSDADGECYSNKLQLHVERKPS